MARKNQHIKTNGGKPAPVPPKSDDSANGYEAGFPIVGVGASAGGLEAFTHLLRGLPVDTGMGFVLVQHLDPVHESALTQILSRATTMPVREVANDETVQPNHVHVIPPDTNLTIARGVLRLHPRERTRTPHRPIDSFFESLAQDQRERAIGVVLSGTATDGTLGLEAIKSEGGITFAQDDSAKHDSMPRSAVAAGCVDLVLSPAEIAQELARIAKHPYVAGQPLVTQSKPGTSGEDVHAEATEHQDDESPLPSGGSGTPETGAKRARAEAAESNGKAAEGYKEVLLQLRNHSGVDFSLYKSTTIQRRINRRMILLKQDTLEGYAALLRGNAKELDSLYSDVLISVTSFFRNPETFDALKREVFPKLLRQRGDDPIRCWVLGCSTGQEAYSVAIAFVEAAEQAQRMRKLQVFATDLNESLLDKARHGLYARSLAQDISPERLRKFFSEEEGGYRVNKALRELVVFARQNLISDPPFSRLDLVSCRNLLIYLEASLQKKALPTFHYALKPGGFLLLGASESIGGFTELFEPIDKKFKIYSRKPAPTPSLHLPAGKGPRIASAPKQPPLGSVQRDPDPLDGLRGELNTQREADRIAVNQYAPPGVLVNSELQVLQFRGPTGNYLEPPTGKATFDVLKMAREGLMLPLRGAINQARKEDKTARVENVKVKRNGDTHTIDVQVIPLGNLRERCFLIVFEDTDGSAQARDRSRRQPKPQLLGKEQESARISELEIELSETREYLQFVQEQHEAATEELQASNEEVQSANEELQSINEELETSKEELESANEELVTVNDEMVHRNVELSQLNDDLNNLQNSTRLPIIVLGRDLAIRRFTPQAEKQFDLLPTDVGRPISHIRHGFIAGDFSAEVPFDLEKIGSEVIASVRERESEVRDRAGRWHSLRVRPYMTIDNRVDGAVLVLVDIEAVKQNERLKASRDFAQATIDTLREPLIILDKDLRVHSAGRAFYRHFGVRPEQTVGQFIYELGNGQWNIPGLRDMLEDILPQKSQFNDFEVNHEFVHLGSRTMRLNARRLSNLGDQSEWILLAIEDITDRNRAEKALQAAAELEASYQQSPIGMLELDSELRYVRINEAMASMNGIPAADHIGRTVREMVPGIADKVESTFRRILKDGKPVVDIELVGETPAEPGVQRTWLESWVPVLNDAGQVTGLTITAQDITDKKRAEEIQQENEQRLRFTLESANAGDWDLDLLTGQAQCSFRHDQCFGATEPITDWNYEKFLSHIHPEDRASEEAKFREAVATGTDWNINCRVVWADGSEHWIESSGRPYRFVDGKPTRMLGMVREVTEERLADIEREGHLAEINLLNIRLQRAMAETHHRVKNNLQVVSALVDMQVLRDSPDVPKSELIRIGHHVRSLAAIHDLLTQKSKVNPESDTINVKEAVDKLAPLLLALAVDRPLRFDVANIAVPLRHGTSLAVLVNELVSNAIKHGAGDIEVSLRAENGFIRLEVCDAGPGFPEGFDPKRAASTGLELIESLSRLDLQGTSAYENLPGGGARVVVQFRG